MAEVVTANHSHPAPAVTHSAPTDILPDVTGVKSRVSWPAIVGGAMVALSAYLVLTLLLVAIGVTAADHHVRVPRPDIIGTTAVITSIVVSLFLGGWVASQLTAGENRQEAVIYGILTWATVTALSLFLVASGVRTGGYLASLGAAVAGQVPADRLPSAEDVAKKAGATDAQIADAKDKINNPQKLDTPENRDRAERVGKEAADVAVTTSWTALVGTMLSMAAAVGGALAGVGTQFRLFPVAVSTGSRRVGAL